MVAAGDGRGIKVGDAQRATAASTPSGLAGRARRGCQMVARDKEAARGRRIVVRAGSAVIRERIRPGTGQGLSGLGGSASGTLGGESRDDEAAASRASRGEEWRAAGGSASRRPGEDVQG